jgi:hypothetical protein
MLFNRKHISGKLFRIEFQCIIMSKIINMLGKNEITKY